MIRGFPVYSLLVFLLLAYPAGPVFARTFLVDVRSTSRQPDGSHVAPFPSIDEALSRVRAGDTILLREGIYHTQIEPRRSGRDDAFITIRNYAGEQPVIDAEGYKAAVLLQGVSHVRIEGLTLTHSQDSCIVIMHYLNPENGASQNEILNNRFHDCGRGKGGNGIFVGGHRNLISGNTIINHGQRKENTKGHAIYVLGNQNIVSDNCLLNNKRNGIRMEGDYNVITGNYIEGSTEYGVTIWVDAPLTNRHTYLLGNWLVNNRQGGIRVWDRGSGEKPQYITIRDNRFISDNTPFAIRTGKDAHSISISQNWFTGHFREGFLVPGNMETTRLVDNYLSPSPAEDTHPCRTAPVQHSRQSTLRP